MNKRRWAVAAGVAAVLALAAAGAILVGANFGRSIVPKTSPERTDFKRWEDSSTDLSMSYPASWQMLGSRDPDVRFVAAGGGSESVLVRVTQIGIATVTKATLPIVKPLTDDLLRADRRATLQAAPQPIELGGLPGYRYRYTYASSNGRSGAHVHYFLFRDGRLIQLVFQAVPASRMPALTPTFNRIAATFKGSGA